MVLQLSKALFSYQSWCARMPFLQNFKLEMKFLATENSRQVKLPKFSGEAQRRRALIEIRDPFEAQNAPEVCEADVGADRTQLNRSIKRKRRAIWHEASEGVTIEMVSVGRVGGPVWI